MQDLVDNNPEIDKLIETLPDEYLDE